MVDWRSIYKHANTGKSICANRSVEQWRTYCVWSHDFSRWKTDIGMMSSTMENLPWSHDIGQWRTSRGLVTLDNGELTVVSKPRTMENLPWSHNICGECRMREFFLCIKIWITIEMYVSIISVHYVKNKLTEKHVSKCSCKYDNSLGEILAVAWWFTCVC